MSGIYIHVPFCRAACHYCDFHFSTSLERVDAYVKSLLSEIQMRAQEQKWNDLKYQSLYLGGGTPSVLSIDQTKQITSLINSSFNTFLIETTLEVNPEDITAEKLDGWLKCGIDRLSIGIQSMDDHQLDWMNRKHSSEDAIKAVLLAKKAGFENITVDLIYGIPERKENSWRDTVNTALDLPINHISCYSLTVEPRTVLGHRVSKGLVIPAPDSLVERDYSDICELTKFAGFEHYEVSNWAKPGSKAVHNSSYWEGSPYLGLGPGAHGFDGDSRYAVLSNNPRYFESLSQGIIPTTTETLSARDRSNELLMTGFRTSRGVDFAELHRLFGTDHLTENSGIFDKRLNSGHLEQHPTLEGRFIIPEKHWIIGDSIASDFFVL